ncbi:MAG: magnesium transporter [Spirochaetes bacterium GWD1_61_31]|nr:MAG: magnesium transporter [Spirochaetes bacterium GWB1_60_80]OHD35166.1 MAG: magnesium transporter [Spirochaetes bacterium GWC1_61_12]OHD43079.1 MAG: magnesium transporter [Spirochaetes bacterium GWE1_60_18]OHD43523.1 MAG: magnesium transporter [Spirochaetes bacterium GWD1_61_31]OHD59674.1 MAG: magnesium transporter [Spirochaetes bacterium GWF1_60_12]HAP44096.1 magnesium transporter [Spirochaetaceae bacterium]
MLDRLIAPDIKAAIDSGDLSQILDFFRAAHAADAAEILAGLAVDDDLAILKLLEPELVADIFSELPDTLQTELAGLLTPAELTGLASDLSPDDRVDLLKTMPEERMAEVMQGLDKPERDEVKALVLWPEGTAGSLMTTEFIALPASLTVTQAMARIRKEAVDKESVYNSYVVDAAGRPLGVVNLRDLILAEPEATLRQIMDDQLPTVAASADDEESTWKLARYDLVDLAVVDEAGVLVGLVTHDDAMDNMEREHTEDMERFMGITGTADDTSYLRTPVWTHFRHRVGWLVVLTVLGLVSGLILEGFEDLLTGLMVLAFYMPMLVATGGNTGSQAATMVVRSLALKELAPRDALRVLWKELRIALLLCLVLGALAFGRVWLFTGAGDLPAGITVVSVGLTITLALVVQVISAGLIGALLPLTVARFGLDPALVASPALATVVDITGLLIYFSIARLVLGL